MWNTLCFWHTCTKIWLLLAARLFNWINDLMGHIQMCTGRHVLVPPMPVKSWLCHHFGLTFLLSPAWVHLSPRWPGRRTDGQHLLGVVLPGTWDSARWADAKWEDHWGWRWLLHHLLLWNWSWKACATCCLCGPGTYCNWWVFAVAWSGHYTV